MKLNWKAGLCFLVVITLTGLMVIQGQMGAKKQKPEPEEPDITQFPTVEFSEQKVRTEKQKKRSKKYNTSSPAITEESNKIFHVSDWDRNLPALPVNLSAAVVIGEVIDAHAYLSEDKSGIYSEFDVQIHQVLKNDNRFPLAANSSMVLERPGGRVRFPSGKTAFSAVNHQDLPRVGKRYLFFLTHEGPDAIIDEDFHILTGYELRNGQVFPLDKPGNGHPITAYKGVSETSLLTDLTLALTNTLTQSK